MRRDEAYGHAVLLDNYRLSPDHVADLLQDAGFVVHTQMLREPSSAHEKAPQAFMLAHKPDSSSAAQNSLRGA
ncbi:MAG: hypothetical protein ACXVW8_11900 [Nocardioidaceae bacterium]